MRRYVVKWFQDAWEYFSHEIRQIFTDGGVLLIFFVAGLVYPLLYNVVYRNGILENTPLAVVDQAQCAESRRFIREVDATRECEVAFRCVSLAEAEQLMRTRKVNGILLFPADFGERLARRETAVLSLYADMSTFLYYKNVLMATNLVMLGEYHDIQIERYAAAGLTDAEIQPLVQPLRWEENNPYNRAGSYSIFLISVILLAIVQQTMFYGMSLLAGTRRERRRHFRQSEDGAWTGNITSGHGVGRIVLGRGAAYWLVYLGITFYVAMIVPAIFGIPQNGRFMDLVLLILFFVTDCVFFATFWSSFIVRRESVFVLFLFMSPICVFLTGITWPTAAFPTVWKLFSWIFPTTFGCQAFVNINTAGGDLYAAESQFFALTIQTVVYYLLASVAVYVENWLVRNHSRVQEVRERLAARS